MSAATESAGAAPNEVRYSIFVLVPSLPEDDCDDLALQFSAYGPVVPRIGERLEFDGPQGRNLSLLVSEVEHVFEISSERSAPRTRVLLTAELIDSPTQYRTARELLDPAALKQWMDHFPMLEFPEHLRRALL